MFKTFIIRFSSSKNNISAMKMFLFYDDDQTTIKDKFKSRGSSTFRTKCKIVEQRRAESEHCNS